MPLTPENVRNKRFTPVRLREGYDMGEVDQFLDEVETELERLAGENTDLRSQGTAASSGQDVPLTPHPDPVAESEPEPQPQPAPTPAVAPISIGEASTAAARLLEIATRNADEVVSDAKEQADGILEQSRTAAEQLDEESKGKAERVESDARTRADKLDAETASKRQQLFGDIERDRDTLTGEVEHLRAFEREFRSRLKDYFSAQLAQLDGEEVGAAQLLGGADDHTPQRLRSLLGDDETQDQP